MKLIRPHRKNGSFETTFKLYQDDKIFSTELVPCKEFDFDQDVDTDDEALFGSIKQCQNQFKQSMSEFLAMPAGLRHKMLKS